MTMTREPAVIIGGVVTLLVTVGLLTPDEGEGLVGLFAQAVDVVTYGSALIAAILIRLKVWSPATHKRELAEVEQAVQDGPPETL